MEFETIISKLARGKKIKVHITGPDILYLCTGYVLKAYEKDNSKRVRIKPFVLYRFETIETEGGIVISKESGKDQFPHLKEGLEVMIEDEISNRKVTSGHKTHEKQALVLAKDFYEGKIPDKFRLYIRLAKKL